ncbi:AAA-like domain-containing protein [Aetokthonos hydrillicola Thurmond2011]|jgi:tetratricopeptide (TPR) repeat protein|uniref:AAA-like domain-containing protein n=1 Tax=Aetokthonos hydrillicola Thurmond2011 TaxID=2712845 RepID=A0AAP5ICG5_9CYAN|nr:AAA-like domain-containing protein [Aetokthonos hydrillicola]MBO3462128.1 tetratricopeptide repeat protein [Aetokthonos hydrillicola CCALA 1050]MBW4589722.1 AAA-like domain-containing protein [Aetokthonos hydrillicola CCALA 1050]MDR9898976.1 AAA-like domain-containing protein [Aetokthonos hydrillicola Thurmond2011]
MNTSPNSGHQYQVGGSLPESSTTYVKRQADTDFYEGLKAGDFCYVLNCRQMGKSSLRIQTMKALKSEGFACVAIEMRDICSHKVTDSQFYGGFASLLISGFSLEIDLGSWWDKLNYISPVMRLSKFLEEELLDKISQNIVIFVDEIDSVLSLDFKDDFFAFIRSCYNKRAENPKYNRLIFALLGVAAPADLIKDKIKSTFNIGKAIELSGFQLDQTKPLQKGLQGQVDDPEALLKEVLVWTGGQPFLTQWLCHLVVEEEFISAGSEAHCVEKIVHSRMIENWQVQDKQQHFKTIRERIFSQRGDTIQRLKLYEQILQQKEVGSDDTLEQMDLRLSGLVIKQQGKLRVHNQLYKFIFNQNWINQELLEWTTESNNFVPLQSLLIPNTVHVNQTELKQNTQSFIWQLPKILSFSTSLFRLLYKYYPGVQSRNKSIYFGCSLFTLFCLFLYLFINLFNYFIVQYSSLGQVSNNQGNYKNLTFTEYYQQGQAFYKEGKYPQAVESFTNALQKNHKNAKAYIDRGDAHYNLKEYEIALADYNQAIRLNSNEFKAYKNRGKVLFLLAESKSDSNKEYNLAIADFNRALLLNSNEAEAYVWRGKAYSQIAPRSGFPKEEYQKAIKDFNLALKLDPLSAEAYFERGIAHTQMASYVTEYNHEYQQAIEDFNHAISINSKMAKAYLQRGIARYDIVLGSNENLQENCTKAAEDFQTSQKMSAQNDLDTSKQALSRLLAMKQGYCSPYALTKNRYYGIKPNFSARTPIQ